MAVDDEYEDYAHQIGDDSREKHLGQSSQSGGAGEKGRLRTNRFDTGARRGTSANIVETPDGDVVVVDSDFNPEKIESEIDSRLGEGDSLYMVSTHAHEDHTSNNKEILDNYDVEAHYVPPKHRADEHLTEEDVDKHQENDTDIVEVASGDEITIGDASFEIDHPPRESVEETSPELGVDANENSLGVTVSYADSADPDPAVEDYTARFNGDKLEDGQEFERQRHEEEFKERNIDDTEGPHHGDENAAIPDYIADEGAQHVYMNAALYDKKNEHPNQKTFSIYDEETDVYWSGVHGDFQHDGEGSPNVERDFSTDPKDLKMVRQRVEDMKEEEPENAEEYDNRFEERYDQYDPQMDDPVEELQTILDDEEFEQVYEGETIKNETPERRAPMADQSDSDEETVEAESNVPEIEGDRSEVAESESPVIEGDRSETTEGEGPVIEGDQSEAAESEGHVIEGDRSETAQEEGPVIEGDQSEAAEQEGPEIAGDQPETDESEGPVIGGDQSEDEQEDEEEDIGPSL